MIFLVFLCVLHLFDFSSTSISILSEGCSNVVGGSSNFAMSSPPPAANNLLNFGKDTTLTCGVEMSQCLKHDTNFIVDGCGPVTYYQKVDVGVGKRPPRNQFHFTFNGNGFSANGAFHYAVPGGRIVIEAGLGVTDVGLEMWQEAFRGLSASFLHKVLSKRIIDEVVTIRFNELQLNELGLYSVEQKADRSLF